MNHGSRLDPTDRLMFETDRRGVIQDVGANSWNAFAMENEAPELSADAVIGRSLFDFIEGAEIQNQFRSIMDRIAQDPNWAWVLQFRCDAPGRKRIICQSLKPIFSDGQCTGFLFQFVEQNSQQRPPMGLYDFKQLKRLAKADSHLPVVEMCSWCQRVKDVTNGGGEWVSGDDYYAAGGRSEVRLTHTICEDCLRGTADPFLTEEARP